MTKLTIIYTDGYTEHYNIIDPINSANALTGEIKKDDKMINTMTGTKRFKEIIEDGMLKLVIEGMQVVLIPIGSIRKIMAQTDNPSKLKAQDYPGFLNAKPAEEI